MVAPRTRIRHQIFGVLTATIFVSTLAFGTAASGASSDAALFGSGAAMALNKPVVGMAATPSGHGYWLTASDGGIFTFGDAQFYGSTGNLPLNRPIVGMASTPSGHGYWLVANDGGIFSFGDATFYGSTGNLALNRPIVGMASTQSGHGYWLTASDGGIFSFGDATFYGSTGNTRLNRSIAGMASTASGHGYWLVANDGGIFSFGDAQFYGSTGNIRLNRPIVDMASTPTGHGYWLVANDGGIFSFGDAHFYGSAGNNCIGSVIGMSTSAGASGYWIAASNGAQAAFSNSTTLANGTPCESGTEVGGAQTDVAAQDFFNRVNSERAARGLPTLAWDQGLAESAQAWSVQMGTSNNFKHSDLTPLLGRFSAAAENIAYGGPGVTIGAVHVAWMNSDGHRANILAPNLDVMGVGLYCAPNGTMWATQQFGRFPNSSKPSGWGPTPPAQPITRTDAGSVACP